MVSRARRYPLGRVARLSGLAGATHVLVSLVLGAIIVAIGLQFRSVVLHAEDAIVGGLLIATGGLFAAFELAGAGHRHLEGEGYDGHHHHGAARHDHEADAHADHKHRGLGGPARGAAAMMVPFGAAASPDLTILPVFLAATAAGADVAIGSLLAFALVTVGTFVVLTVAATAGGYQLRTTWLDRFAGAITAAVLVVLGILVAASVI